LGGRPSGKGREKLQDGRLLMGLSLLIEESGRLLWRESAEHVELRDGTGLGRAESMCWRRVGVVCRTEVASREQRVDAGISSATMPFRSLQGLCAARMTEKSAMRSF